MRILLSVAFALLLVGCAHRAPVIAPFETLSLDELLHRSELVVAGRITRIGLVELKDKSPIDVTLSFAWIYLPAHYSIPANNTLVVRLPYNQWPRLELNDHVLWFLGSNKSGRTNFIVGGGFGYFWIRTANYGFWRDHRVAANSANNRGLWGDRLWSDAISWQKVALYLSVFPESTIDAIFRTGEAPRREGPLPLEMLEAVIEDRASQQRPR
ncbi:MAG: hypothetical protein Q7R67_00785 [bacterium]|nr:hypothetical protein [bacterium]